MSLIVPEAEASKKKRVSSHMHARADVSLKIIIEKEGERRREREGRISEARRGPTGRSRQPVRTRERGLRCVAILRRPRCVGASLFIPLFFARPFHLVRA